MDESLRRQKVFQWRQELEQEKSALEKQVAKLDETINKYKAERGLLLRRLGRIHNSLSDGRTFNHRANDSTLVYAVDLVYAIKRWMDAYNAESPTGDGARLALGELSGVSTKIITNIMRGNAEYVTFQTADLILTAIERIDVLDEVRQISLSARKKQTPPQPPNSQFYEE